MNTYTTAGAHKATYSTATTRIVDIAMQEAKLELQARDAYYDAMVYEDALVQGLRFEQWLKATDTANKAINRMLAYANR